LEEAELIKAYIIDDDPPSIKVIEYFLKAYEMVEIAGAFTDPLTALAHFEQDMPRLVFLDINMAEMNGMEAAGLIASLSPETDIIFTTAYDHFAVDAFELNAADYIVKPVMKPRFDKSMERVIRKYGNTEETTERLSIRCFGKFGISYERREPIKWRTEKSRELAALLVYKGGREIGRDEIIELLWHDTEPDRAVHYLHNSIYYIRKSFEDYGIGSDLIKISGTYAFVIRGDVDIDLGRYQALLERQETDNAALEALLSICKAGFMEGEDWDWAFPERAGIEDTYMNAALKLSAAYIREKDVSKAEDILKQAYGKNPFDERISTRLIRLYIHSNQNIKAVMHYNAYSEMVRNELGLNPGKFLRELIASIQ
jgi:two-component SAPR family response regulator